MKIDKKTKEKMSRIAHNYAPIFLGPYMIVHATEAKFFKEEFINMAFDNIHDDDLEDLLENNYI